MIRSLKKLSPEARAFLDAEGSVPELPSAVRARAIGRARDALAARAILPLAPPPRVTSPARWAATVTLAALTGAASVVAAYGIHAHFAQVEPSTQESPLATPVLVVAVPKTPDAPEPLPPVDEEAPPSRSGMLPTRRPSPADALRAELHVLRQARAAVAHEDFAAALAPIAEHTRRFRHGRLAEEREALRVKALVGLGRNEDARRAASSFRTCFPNSVLLRAVGQMSASGH